MFWSKVLNFLGILEFSTDQPRTAHVSLHVVHPLQCERLAAAVIVFLPIDNFEYTMHVSSRTPFLLFAPSLKSFGQIPRAVDIPSLLQVLQDSLLRLALKLAKCSSQL